MPAFGGWVVGAEISGAPWQAGFADPLLAFSVHAPSKGEAYWKQVNKLLDAIRQVTAGRAVVLGGDFNVAVSYWPGPERPTGQRDLAIQARLAGEFGLVNCWQAAHPGRPLAQTLRWANAPATPYHCDGLFVPAAWGSRLASCDILSGGEWDRLSDHNPVLARFWQPGQGDAGRRAEGAVKNPGRRCGGNGQ